jgi:hypothetical protein
MDQNQSHMREESTRAESGQEDTQRSTIGRDEQVATEWDQKLNTFNILEYRISVLEKAVETAHMSIQMMEARVQALSCGDASLRPGDLLREDPFLGLACNEALDLHNSDHWSSSTQHREDKASEPVTPLPQTPIDDEGWFSSIPAFEYMNVAEEPHLSDGEPE